VSSGLYQNKEFLELPEEERIVQARAKDESFNAFYKANPERAIETMREITGQPKENTSVVGRVIRQTAYGVGESVLDTAQLPFEAAEWVASKAGSDWSTDVDDRIEEYKAETFEEPTTPEGRVARKTGYWSGVGLQTFATGGVATWASSFPYMGKLAKVGSVLSGGAKVEVGGGAAAGLAEGLVGEGVDDDNPSKPWLEIGAGILAGGATGVAIAARGASKRARLRAAEGEQPTSPVGDGSLNPPEAALDAVDDITTNEQRQLMEAAEAGHLGGGQIGDYEKASADSITKQMLGWTGDTYGGVQPARMKELVDGVGNIMQEAGLPNVEGRTLISQIADAMETGLVSRERADEILKNFDTNVIDIAALSHPAQATATQAARTLALLSHQSRRMNKKALQDSLASMSDEELRIMRSLDPNIEGLGFWQRMENVRRGLLVTQIATAMRNVETQTANIGVHALEDTFENVLHKMFGSAKSKPIMDGEGIQTVLRLGEMMMPRQTTSRSYKEVEALKDHFGRVDMDPADQALFNPLFANFSSDVLINPAKDKLGFLEKSTLWLNSANRLQEFGIRRAVFTATLDSSLAKKGQSLSKVIDAGGIGDLDRGDIKNAIGKALETTWGEDFHANMDGAAGIAGKVISAINGIGAGPLRLTQVVPFPRFMANSIKWQYQHSPLPAMKMLVSPKGWQEISQGNITPLIKSTTGTAMFASAYQLRNSEYAGEKWYEVRPSDEVNRMLGQAPGATLDTRAYNPFASMLFAADLLTRAKNGTLNNLSTRDVAMGIASVNLRAGAGMYVLDKFLDTLGAAASGISNPEEELIPALADGAAGYAGAAWAGMFVPFQQLKDIATNFDEMLGTDNTTVRDVKDSPLMGQIMRKLPYGDENMEGVELPTREAAPYSESPMARFLGATWRGPKNPVEKELDRLGFSRSNILPGSGNDDWNRLRAKHMGPIVEQQIPKYLESDQYQRADDDDRFIALETLLSRARKVATRKAARDSPELAKKVKFNSKRKSIRRRASKRLRQAEERSERMREIMED